MSRLDALIRVGCFASCIAILEGCASGRIETVPGVPEALRVPGNEVVSLELHGVGVQIYECQASQDGQTRFTWVFKSPAADLLDQTGNTVGRHYAGPTWEANDGSKVIGEIVARDEGPDAGAIPWLLLRATSNMGKGVFARAQFIQRLHTVGGKAPATDCDATQAGRRIRVAYAADYYFYRARK
ncbi:MAG: DUF3455 domain-containing protein [Steroidobacteraceae bacterium]